MLTDIITIKIRTEDRDLLNALQKENFPDVRISLRD
jgi:hypothetical protein